MGAKLLVDRVGKVYGELTVLSRDPASCKGNSLWLCECSCGNVRSVRSGNLVAGRSLSCRRCPVNTYVTYGDVSTGLTRKGETYSISTIDLPRLSKYTWHISAGGYVQTTIGDDNLLMHRMLLGCSDAEIVDHEDRVKTNNVRSNLRIVSHSLNSFNSTIRHNNTSGKPGVCWHKKKEKWCVQINCNGARKNLGEFEDINDAIKERLAAELKYFGEYSAKEVN